MHHCRLIFGLSCAVLVSACAKEPVPIMVDVPQELRQPVEVPKRQTETLRDVGLILADHAQALETANGRIVSIDCILSEAETGVRCE